MRVLKYYITTFIILLVGAFLLFLLLNDYNELEKQKVNRQLNKAHTNAIIRAKAGIEVYASLVSSFKSFTKNTREFPSEKQLQNYLSDFLKEIRFNDSLLINYIDTAHVFKYVITPQGIDPSNLKGISVKNIRDEKRIKELNDLMNSKEIKLFTPINLREGWAGFPFNFSARNNKNEVLGYVTPIINVKYLLDYFYENHNEDLYVHKFLVNGANDLTREAYYNGSPIYNKIKDKEYYKNFEVEDKAFIYSTIDLFGLKLKIGSAYKVQPVVNHTLYQISYLWYGILCILIFLALYQYLKNESLNKKLQEVNVIVVSKNDELEQNLFKIKSLIKEIHHRIRNNMQMISGVLAMQKREYDDENIINALSDSQSRIQSMSLVHEKLYGNESLKDVRIKEYISQLIEFVEETIREKELIVEKLVDIPNDLIFDAETTFNLGLIINELITNSYKYAFSRTEVNKLSLNIVKEEEVFKLIYKDSGEGLPEGFNLKASKSLGLQLIYILTDQLKGVLEYEKSPQSTFVIHFTPKV
ncbi:sensor histidine kinase [Tenacibaculum sp. 190130A14a]|uniref:sensor histidine kinase n=1 Tax=Tenacibaculum polynesiense TaxID=3137857 RepID=UPI0032B265F7